jgi:hypothetical protein
MKISVPLLLTAPVIAVVIILSVIAYVEGKSTANELMAQNLAQIHEHIEKRLKNFFNLPKQIQQLNAHLIGEGLINLKNLRSWRKILLEQVQAFDGLSAITWGSVDGRSVGISRKPDGSGYEFTIKDEQTGKAFLIDHRGRLIATSTGIPVTDIRNYPVIASATADRQIAAAASRIEEAFDSLKDIGARYQLNPSDPCSIWLSM